jgi:hypothetical protein
MNEQVKLTVGFFRSVGLEARWSRTQAGQPCLCLRKPGDRNWYVINDRMWEDFKTGADPVEVFERHTLLGSFFSIPA